MGQTKELVDRWWATFDAGDVEAAAKYCAPDVDFVMPGGVHLRGPEQIRPLLQGYREAFPDMRHEIIDYVESGSRIAVELKVTGTHTGTMRTPTGNIPPTGRRVVWESVDFIKAEGGKITSWHAYFDQVAFLTQLGLMPPLTAP